MEVFLLEKKQDNIWKVMIKPAKRVKQGTEIEFSEELKSQNVLWMFGGDATFSFDPVELNIQYVERKDDNTNFLF